jgi:hypothetical protein
MATESVVSPVLLDHPIAYVMMGGQKVPVKMNQYLYSLLSGLQLRTGGTVGEVVDIPALEEGIDDAKAAAESAALAPAPLFVKPAQTPDAGVEYLAAEVARLRKMVEGLQKGYHL